MMNGRMPSREEFGIAIREKCLECAGGSRNQVDRCNLTGCPLHAYRSLKAMGIQSEKARRIKGQVSLFEIAKREA